MFQFPNVTHHHTKTESLVEDAQFSKYLKKRLWHKCFPVNFAKFLRTPFLQIIFFTEHLLATVFDIKILGELCIFDEILSFCMMVCDVRKLERL